MLNEIDTSRLLRLSPDVRLRREHFGGLAFKAADMAVYETNHLSYRLIEMVDGARSLNEIIQSGVHELGGSRDAVERVLSDMISAGILTV